MSPCSSCVRYRDTYESTLTFVRRGGRPARASTEPSSPLSNIVLCVLSGFSVGRCAAQRARVIINLMRVDRRRASRLTSCRGPCGIVHREAHPRAPTCADEDDATTYVRSFELATSISSHLMRRIPQTHGPSATVSRNPTMPAPNKPDANVKSSHSCTLAVPVLGSWLVRFLPESKVTDVIS